MNEVEREKQREELIERLLALTEKQFQFLVSMPEWQELMQGTGQQNA